WQSNARYARTFPCHSRRKTCPAALRHPSARMDQGRRRTPERRRAPTAGRARYPPRSPQGAAMSMTTPWPTEAQAAQLARHIGAAYQAIVDATDSRDQAADAGEAILQILNGLPLGHRLLALAGAVADCLGMADEHHRPHLMGAFVRIVAEMRDRPDDDPET